MLAFRGSLLRGFERVVEEASELPTSLEKDKISHFTQPRKVLKKHPRKEDTFGSLRCCLRRAFIFDGRRAGRAIFQADVRVILRIRKGTSCQ